MSRPQEILDAYNGAFVGDPGPPEPGFPEPSGNGHQRAESSEAVDRPVLADKLLTRSALRALPTPEPLIENTLDKGTFALLYGPRSAYKTFVALDWALSAATRHRWQGRTVDQCRVLYVAAEGAFGIQRRVEAWEIAWRNEVADDVFAVLPEPVNLTRPLDVANLAALIQWGGYEFIVLDTLARCMVGADENSARDCGIVVDALIRLREYTLDGRGVVLGVHHAGKDGKTFRGSSVFEAGADTVYSMTRDGNASMLERRKRKDGPQLDVHRLKLDLIDGTKSGVIGVSRGETNVDRADILLSHFNSHFEGTGAYATQLLEVAEMSKATFYRALSDLVKRGELVNEGSDKRPFYKAGVK